MGHYLSQREMVLSMMAKSITKELAFMVGRTFKRICLR